MTMTTFLRTAARGTARIGAVVAFAAFFEMSPPSFNPAGLLFAAWVLFPWVLTDLLARGPLPSPIRDGVLITLGVFWAFAYRGVLFPPERLRSTSGLDLLFIPFWHLLCLVVPAAMRLWQRWRLARRAKP